MDSNGGNGRCPDPPPSKVLIMNPWFTRPHQESISTGRQSHFVASVKCREFGPASPKASSSNMGSTSSTFYQKMTDVHETNKKIEGSSGQMLACLLCTDPIDDKKENLSTKKYRLVRNLCSQLHLSPKGFPKNPKCYPLCTGCEKMLKTIWDCQQIITHTITKIERKVADVEILIGGSTNSSQGSDGNNGFIKLRQMILEGYREKLVMEKMERERDKKRKFIRNPFYSKNISAESTEVTFEQKNSIEVKNKEEEEEEEEIPSQNTANENANINTNQVDMVYDNQSGSGEEGIESETIVATASDSDEIEVENTICKLEVVDLEDDFKEEEEEEKVEPPIIGVYNENNCTLTVKYPQPSRKPAQQLNEDKRKRLEAPSQKGQRNETDNDQMPILSAPGLGLGGPPASSLMFKGIRIVRIGGETPEQRYLKCGLCQFTVCSKTNFREEGTLPIQTMKHHIITVHLNMRATPVRSFKDAVFKEPLPVGPPRYQFNPLPPRQSTSVKPTFGGNSKTLVSQIFPPKKKKKGGAMKGAHVPRKYTMPVDKLTGEPIRFPCHLCDRTFSRNCHRVRHLTAHTNKELREQAQRPPVLIPQPTFNPILVAQPEASRMPILLGNESGGGGSEGNATGGVDEILRAMGIQGQ